MTARVEACQGNRGINADRLTPLLCRESPLTGWNAPTLWHGWGVVCLPRALASRRVRVRAAPEVLKCITANQRMLSDSDTGGMRVARPPRGGVGCVSSAAPLHHKPKASISNPLPLWVSGARNTISCAIQTERITVKTLSAFFMAQCWKPLPHTKNLFAQAATLRKRAKCMFLRNYTLCEIKEWPAGRILPLLPALDNTDQVCSCIFRIRRIGLTLHKRSFVKLLITLSF